MSVTKYAAQSLTRRPGGPSGHTLVPAAGSGWSDLVVTEWELQAESWTDSHPHTEYNYVLDGVLLVESDGETVLAHTGDVVLVSPGSTGRYWTPTYARLIAIYGPNPAARPSHIIGLGSVDNP